MNKQNLALHERHAFIVELEKFKNKPLHYRWHLKDFVSGLDEIINSHIIDMKKLFKDSPLAFLSIYKENMTFLTDQINLLESYDLSTKPFFTGWLRSITFEGRVLPFLKIYRAIIIERLIDENIYANKISQSDQKHELKNVEIDEMGKLNHPDKMIICYKSFINPNKIMKEYLQYEKNQANLLALLFESNTGRIQPYLNKLKSGTGNQKLSKTAQKAVKNINLDLD